MTIYIIDRYCWKKLIWKPHIWAVVLVTLFNYKLVRISHQRQNQQTFREILPRAGFLQQAGKFAQIICVEKNTSCCKLLYNQCGMCNGQCLLCACWLTDHITSNTTLCKLTAIQVNWCWIKTNLTGHEPATSSLTCRCSTNWALPSSIKLEVSLFSQYICSRPE